MPIFKCALDVDEYIQEHFPGVNIAFKVPKKEVLVASTTRPGRKVSQWVPLTEEELAEILPLIEERNRLYNQPIDAKLTSEDVLGDRMI